MQPSAHSLFAPSGAYIWGNCTASVLTSSMFPALFTSDEGEEGDAAHYFLAEHMTKGMPLEVGKQKAPNGIFLDEDMVDAIELFKEECPPPPGGNCGNEVLLRMETVHPQCWGTADYYSYDPVAHHLVIVDFKYGFSFVNEYENFQLILYAIGLLDTFAPPPDLKITLKIVQPRCYGRNPVREWSLKLPALNQWRRHLRSKAEEAAMGGEHTVGDWCKHCEGRRACPALRDAALVGIDMSQQVLPVEASPEAASMELLILTRYLKLMEARVAALEEQVLSNLKTGKPTPDWTLASGQTRTKWTVSDEDVIELGNMLGLSLSKPPAAVTPKQAQRLGLSEDLAKKMSETPSGALKLKPFDRKAARRAFDND